MDTSNDTAYVNILDVISDDARAVFVTVNYGTLNVIVALLGTLANTVNIIVFRKQGFGTPTNLSLFVLAVSDLGALIAALMFGVFSNPLFLSSELPVSANELQSSIAGWPRGAFARITSWITAFVTFERCLCVALPFQVRSIVTTRVAVLSIVTIFVSQFLTLVPQYMTFVLDWKYYPGQNRTLIGIVFTRYRDSLNGLTFTLHIVSQLISFLLVLIFTCILIAKIEQNSRWRRRILTASDQSRDSVFKRDAKTIRMITVLAVIYILCHVTNIIDLIIAVTVPEFNVVGRFKNGYTAAFSISLVFENLNSSVTIVLYYTMSTKYRNTMITLLTPSRDKSI